MALPPKFAPRSDKTQLVIGSGLHHLFCGELSQNESKQNRHQTCAAKFVGVTRINVSQQDTSGPSHFVSKLAQNKLHIGVALRLQESLACGRLSQEGCTWLHSLSLPKTPWLSLRGGVVRVSLHSSLPFLTQNPPFASLPFPCILSSRSVSCLSPLASNKDMHICGYVHVCAYVKCILVTVYVLVSTCLSIQLQLRIYHSPRSNSYQVNSWSSFDIYLGVFWAHFLNFAYFL